MPLTADEGGPWIVIIVSEEAFAAVEGSLRRFRGHWDKDVVDFLKHTTQFCHSLLVLQQWLETEESFT